MEKLKAQNFQVVTKGCGSVARMLPCFLTCPHYCNKLPGYELSCVIKRTEQPHQNPASNWFPQQLKISQLLPARWAGLEIDATLLGVWDDLGKMLTPLPWFLSSETQGATTAFLTVFVSIIIAGTKNHDQKQLVRGKGLFHPQFPIRFHHQKQRGQELTQGRNTWRQELMQRSLRVLITGLLLMAYSVCFSIELKPTSPGMAPPTMGKALPYQTWIKKIPYRLAFSRMLWRHFLDEAPSSQMTFACVRLT